MNIPGFSAEESLGASSNFRLPSAADLNMTAGVRPQSTPPFVKCAQNCERLCEGDIIGNCEPWCLCRCRGGRHCGLPS